MDAADMKKVNLHQFYSFGSIVHPLTEIKEGDEIKQINWKLQSAKSWLEFFCEDNMLPLVVCKTAARKVIESVSPATEFAEDKKLDFLEAYEIRTSAREFETVFSAEIQTFATYFASQKGIYSTSDLIERTGKVFPESLRSRLPKECIADISQAGKCIAFEVPTAAAFHIIRATESVIRLYYAYVVKKPLKPQLRNWGAYIKNLNEAGADPKITGFLDHIRELHRNPVLHPEEMLTSEDALVLMGAATSAIVQMMLAIPESSPEKLHRTLGISSAVASLQVANGKTGSS
jgi:hypothetical protein